MARSVVNRQGSFRGREPSVQGTLGVSQPSRKQRKETLVEHEQQYVGIDLRYWIIPDSAPSAVAYTTSHVAGGMTPPVSSENAYRTSSNVELSESPIGQAGERIDWLIVTVDSEGPRQAGGRAVADVPDPHSTCNTAGKPTLTTR
jgi:hypothetical protein